MKLTVFSITTKGEYFEYGARINRTFILVYNKNDISSSGKLILKETSHGLYTFLVNRDFKLLFRRDLNIQISIIGQDLIYYSNVGFFNLMKLYFFHKRFWVMKEDNIRWLLNMIIAIVATYAAFKLNQV